MEPYQNRQFGCIDDPDRQSGSGSVPTRTRTRSDGPDPLLTQVLRKGVDFERRGNGVRVLRDGGSEICHGKDVV